MLRPSFCPIHKNVIVSDEEEAAVEWMNESWMKMI